MVPDFICVGTYRAGTTWMYRILEQHPEVWLPNEKEIMFFSHHYQRGIDWYLEFFEKHKERKLVGEICPTYLSAKNSAVRIFKHVPLAKIIVTLREPAAQIYSLYGLTRTRGKKKGPLMDAIRAEKFFINNVLYYQHLMRFLEYFDREKVLVLFYEDMKADHKTYLNSIYEFLGIQKIYPDNMMEKVNYTRKPRIGIVEKIIASSGSYMRKNDMGKLKRQLIGLGLVKVTDKIRKINASNSQQEEMPKEFVEYVQRYVEKDRQKLEELLGRRLEIWDV